MKPDKDSKNAVEAYIIPDDYNSEINNKWNKKSNKISH